MGAHYVSTQRMPLAELPTKVGKADLIVDATGSSAIAFGCMQLLGHNGVLVWTSVTGGRQHTEVPSDKVNLDWVLGNKLLLGSVNANREHFEMGIKDLALGEMMFPGVIQRILTTPIRGLDNYQQMMSALVDDATALKVYVDVAEG
jgi:threonine dehydrogenase-like Zn-dependent dehydrogenase